MEESSFAAAEDQRAESKAQQLAIREQEIDQLSTSAETETEARGLNSSELKQPLNKSDILKAVEVVERDSKAIADSFSSLFASLRLALSEVTSGSVDHMHCFGDAVGCLQESVLDAASKGNRYINSSLRLNEEMMGIDNLAIQLGSLNTSCLSPMSAIGMLSIPLHLKNTEEECRYPGHSRK